MQTLQCSHDVDVHLLFCIDFDLHLICSCFIHVHQHALPRIAGNGQELVFHVISPLHVQCSLCTPAHAHSLNKKPNKQNILPFFLFI